LKYRSIVVLLAAVVCLVFVGIPSPGAIPVYTSDSPPPTPALTNLPLLSSASKDGVTWTFASPARVGTFINGDYYVVGPVTITAIDPPGTNGRNGSVMNLRPNPPGSGFDSRTLSGRYVASLRTNPPISMVPGDALASSISVGTVGAIKRVMLTSDDTISPVRTVSILTCVSDPLPPDAFRPGYCGTPRTIYYSRNLRRDLLPRLAPVAGTPALAEFEGYFRRPWIDIVFFGFDAPIEYMPDYGREVGRTIGNAALLLTLNFTREQKEALLVYFVQYGIDLYAAVRAGHSGWPAHGGHGSGRKLPIVFAGRLLQNTQMQNPPGQFGEDIQTMIATGPPFGPGWTGSTALYAGHVGVNGNQSTGWGPYEHLQPRDWTGNQLGEAYRRCCTSLAWVGEALAARLVGAEAVWNHPALFAYVTRWMNESDAAAVAEIRNQTGYDYSAGWQRQGQTWDPFVDNMWDAYQNYVAPPVPPGVLIARQGGLLQLTWTAGELESAPTPMGPWTRMTGAQSPLQIAPTNGQRFFRAAQ